MKYRVWRKCTRTEYKDVEVETRDEALAHHIDPSEEFTITDNNCIAKWWVEALKGVRNND